MEVSSAETKKIEKHYLEGQKIHLLQRPLQRPTALTAYGARPFGVALDSKGVIKLRLEAQDFGFLRGGDQLPKSLKKLKNGFEFTLSVL